MGKKPQNMNNVFSLFDSLSASELNLSSADYFKAKMRLSSQNLSYSEENLMKATANLPNGRNVASKLKATRYNWLFDDLQQFTSFDLKDFETKKELQEELALLMENASDSSVRKMANGMWLTRGQARSRPAVKQRVERISLERSRFFTRSVRKEREGKLIALANREKIIRVEEKLIVEALNKHGGTYYYNFRNGHRAKNPFK